jgi:uncharacterized membrane protein YfcA
MWREVALLTPGILLGAGSGGVFAAFLSGELLQRLYGGFALLVGLHLFFPWRLGFKPPPVKDWFLGLAGVIIGFISALVGIGGGTMTVPLLKAYGFSMRKAVASSSACGLPIAMAGTLSFILTGWGLEGLPVGSTGYVYWPVMLAIVLTSMLFAPVGAGLAHRLPGSRLQRLFAVFLFLVGGRLLFY